MSALVLVSVTHQREAFSSSGIPLLDRQTRDNAELEQFLLQDIRRGFGLETIH